MSECQVFKKKYKIGKNYRDITLTHIFNPTVGALKNLRNSNINDVLYIIRFEQGVKYGITSCLRKRLVNYMSPWCQKIAEIVVINGRNLRDKNLNIESRIKQKYVTDKELASTEFIVNVKFRDIKHSILDLYRLEEVN